MRRRALPLLGLALLLAGCGGSKQAATTAQPPSTARPAAPAFRISISAPTHHPRANAKWPVTIRVVDASGRPVAGRLKMQILFGGAPVGAVDNGRVYRFVGSWHEPPGKEITWPADAVGQPVVFRAVVTVHGRTRHADCPIVVRR